MKNLLWLILIFAVFILFTYATSIIDYPQRQTVPVIVAARDIPANSMIKPAMIVFGEYPRSKSSAKLVSAGEFESVCESITIKPFAKGEPLSWQYLRTRVKGKN